QGYYRDIALADEIEQHYAAASSEVAPAMHADQFRTQVLIQPWVAHTQRDDQYRLQCAPGSPEAVVAQELGASCSDVLSINDPYNIQMPPAKPTNVDAAAQAVLSDRLQLRVLLGVEPGEILGFPAEQRLGAFRMGGSPPFSDVVTPTPPDFVETYGALPNWDFYHIIYYGRGWDG